ncbi:hypothetical protein AALP_AA1G150300 [Arabis alpina]|uniref:Bifunctional inhibitor/plant lipid transfer protein/seed storage helical domain-containing protein n=1 Tax=Arabis alpina TaxID=50452 RepID=A0A087HNC3_ARAAL|nr:hypothetical protein AALP_AA1G150300 [Arabis alpina]
MANKLFLVSVTLAFFFLLTNASIYRTIVEFDEDDAINPVGPRVPKQKCRKEFQQAKHLQACQQWILKQSRQPGSGPSDLDFEDDFENPQGPQQQDPILQQCCSELRQEENFCVCPTLKRAARAVQAQSQGQQHGQQHVTRIFETAKQLPNVCQIPQVGVCTFKTPSFPHYY